MKMNYCGSCIHINQTRDGIYRWCERKNKSVYALGEPCCAYRDVWEKDIFGYSLHKEIVAKQLKTMKNK